MSENAIRVEDLSKRYRLGERQAGYKTLRESLVNAVGAFIRKRNTGGDGSGTRDPKRGHIWALRDVSFEINQGEVVGIIGRNGAGKSTLLKILSKITEPTKGAIAMRGRVGSLLEVGTGFHPELSGRENAYLYGTILGMNRFEISRKYDEIVAFSEIEQFIDTPVKRYSSGMYMRLAFAVAAHLNPEILIVDEVLAVGDLDFQKKCLGKMQKIAAEGRTLLFVSHNMAAIQQLCDIVIVLDGGVLKYIGKTTNAICYYIKEDDDIRNLDLSERNDRQGVGWLRFTRLLLMDRYGNTISQVISGQDVYIRIYYNSEKEGFYSGACISISFRGGYGTELTNLNTLDTGADQLNIYSEGYFECFWPSFNLRSGVYRLNVYCEINGVVVDWIKDAYVLKVEDGDFYNSGRLVDRSGGYMLVKHTWQGFKTKQ